MAANAVVLVVVRTFDADRHRPNSDARVGIFRSRCPDPGPGAWPGAALNNGAVWPIVTFARATEPGVSTPFGWIRRVYTSISRWVIVRADFSTGFSPRSTGT